MIRINITNSKMIWNILIQKLTGVVDSNQNYGDSNQSSFKDYWFEKMFMCITSVSIVTKKSYLQWWFKSLKCWIESNTFYVYFWLKLAHNSQLYILALFTSSITESNLQTLSQSFSLALSTNSWLNTFSRILEGIEI